MKCPNCATENPDEEAACAMCFFVFQPPAAPPPEASAAPEETAAPEEPAAAAAPAEAPAAAPPPAADAEIKCPNCQAVSPAGSASCRKCYYRFSAAQTPPAAAAPPPPPSASEPAPAEPTPAQPAAPAARTEPIDCPSCGTVNLPEAVECSMCNLVLPQPAPPPVPETATEPPQPEPAAPEAAPPPAVDPPTSEPEPQPPPAAEPAKIECPVCAHPNVLARAQCELCDYELPAPSASEPAPEPAPPAEPPPAAQTPRLTRMSPGVLPLGQPFEQRHTPAPTASDEPEALVCPKCQTVNPAGTLACSMCYFNFEAPPAAQPPAEPETETTRGGEEPTAAPETASARQDQPDGETCPVCNFLNPQGTPACRLCFTVFESTVVPPAEPLREEPAPESAAPEPVSEPAAEPAFEPAAPAADPFDDPAPLASVKPEDLGEGEVPSPLDPFADVRPETAPPAESPVETATEPPESAQADQTAEPESAKAPPSGKVGAPIDVGVSAKDAAANEAALAPRKKRRGRRSFVLIVEDDPEHASLLNTYLESRGVQWRTECSDAKQALIQAEALNVGLVLMDLMLPGFGTGADGYKALRKSSFLEEDLPLIFMTGLPPAKAEKLVPLDDPHVRLVHKPIDFEKLGELIVELTGDQFIKPE